MNRCFDKRFNGQTEEVIEYVRQFGCFKAMDKYDIESYVAFSAWLTKKTGQGKFGLSPVVKDSLPIADQIAQALVSAIGNLQSQVAELRAENKRITMLLKAYQGDKDTKMVGFLDYLTNINNGTLNKESNAH